VAVLPTDTIYGFHCLYSIGSAVERITRLKGRSDKTGFILLASSIEMVDVLVGRWPPGTREKLGELWPATVTAVLPASVSMPASLGHGSSVAVRIPSSPQLVDLIRLSGDPIISTSVNKSGQPPLNRIAEIKEAFPGLEAYISRRGPGGRRPSTVVDLSGGRPRIVRRGRSERRAAEVFGIR
jgi:tRNA threonylcarbamoyl adenosine modification protein (Sua5/YciO/YrdC/YwlC family)